MRRSLPILAAIGMVSGLTLIILLGSGPWKRAACGSLPLAAFCAAMWTISRTRVGARVFRWADRWSVFYKLIEATPECARFPDPDQRHASILNSCRSLAREGWHLVLAGLWFVSLMFISRPLASALSRLVPVLPPDLCWAIIFFGGVAAFFVVVWLVFRARIRRRLRVDLVTLGVPICIHCGYDLRGQTEPRCPECGRAFDPALLRPAEKAAGEP